MKNKLIQILTDNKDNLKYISACAFIMVAGIIYSLSRLIPAEGDLSVHEYSLTEQETVTYTDETESEQTPDEKHIYTYICGAVVNPGVYEISDETRIYECIEFAGGCVEGADISSINLADRVSDGQKIYIPMEGEVVSESDMAGTLSDSRININTATENELTSLPGVGKSRAKDIINYRDKNGSFKSIEDIMNVSGIKEAAFEKIKDLIRV